MLALGCGTSFFYHATLSSIHFDQVNIQRSYSVYKYSIAIKRHWRNQSMQLLTSPILICSKTQFSTLQVGIFYTVTVIFNDSLECLLHNKHVSNQSWNVFLFPHKLIKVHFHMILVRYYCQPRDSVFLRTFKSLLFRSN